MTVLQDLELPLPVLPGVHRIHRVHKAVKVNTAGQNDRNGCEDKHFREMSDAEAHAEKNPEPFEQTDHCSDEGEETDREAHVFFRPFNMRHGDFRVEGKAYYKRMQQCHT